MMKRINDISKDDRELLLSYLDTLVVNPYNTKRLFAIGFLGLPGTGKSTVARLIAETLKLPLNHNDQIRRFLNKKGISGASPRQDLMPTLAEERTEWFYKHHTSAVIDANFGEYLRVSEATAKRNGATLLIVRVECPENVALERIRRRLEANDPNEYSRAGEAHYYRAKTERASDLPPKHILGTVDTTRPLEPQVKQLKIRLNTFLKTGKL